MRVPGVSVPVSQFDSNASSSATPRALASNHMKFKNWSFRATIVTLASGSTILVVVTAIEPHLVIVALLTILVLVALPNALFFDLYNARTRPSVRQFSLSQLLVAVTCLAVYLSLLREPWTFRLRFAVSRPALELLAAQVEQGASPGPQWAGLFFIKKANRVEKYGETCTVLWTESEGGSPSGFVHPAPKLPHFSFVSLRILSPLPPIFNVHSTALQHDPDWFYFIQD